RRERGPERCGQATVFREVAAARVDRVLDLDVVEVRRDLEPAQPFVLFKEIAGPQHDAERRRVRLLGLQVHVPADVLDDEVGPAARIGGRIAVDEGVGERAEEAAGGGDLPVVKLAQVWRSDVAGLAAAEADPVGEVPDAVDLPGGY